MSTALLSRTTTQTRFHTQDDVEDQGLEGWATVARDLNAATERDLKDGKITLDKLGNRKTITPNAARLIAINAERKFRRALLQMAVEFGVIDGTEAEIFKVALHLKHDHVLAVERASRPRRERCVAVEEQEPDGDVVARPEPRVAQTRWLHQA